MKRYYTYAVDSTFTVEIDTDTIEEGRVVAEEKFYEADFGEGENIQGTLLCIEDEYGNRLSEE